ncbi:MAG: transposase [Janthinobacterium lividum]
MKLTFKTNNNICYSRKYHVICCPKYRKKILTGKVEERLEAIFYEICKETRADLIEIEYDTRA